MGRHAAEDPRAELDTTEADIVFLTRTVSAEEAAAVTAVVTAMLHEESAEARQEPPTGQNAWQRSQRAVRSPLDAGPGRWRGFSA